VSERQRQSGGETQLQAGRDIVVHNGMDYDAVKDIVEASAERLRRELTSHAESIVNIRLATLEEKALPRLSFPELIDAFEDPDFQFNILEAQRSASRTDRPEDIDLLVDILEQRAATPASPRLKLATRKALDVVGQLSDGPLSGLTVLWYGTKLFPEASTLDVFLTHMNDHLAVLSQSLPVMGGGWIIDLASLDCIQLGVGFGQLKNFVQLLGQNKAPGFICEGMSSDVANQHRAALTNASGSFSGIIAAHPLDPNRCSLLSPSEGHLRGRLAQLEAGGVVVTTEMKSALDAAIIDNRYGQELPNWESLLRTEVRKFEALHAIDTWWSDFPALQVTPVGVAVGYANLRRLLPGQMNPSFQVYIEN
jgi:hypothetical protein